MRSASHTSISDQSNVKTLLLRLLLLLPLLFIVVVRCCMNVLHRMTSHCVVLCLLSPSLLYLFCTHWLLFLSLILHSPLSVAVHSLSDAILQCAFGLVWFRLFISSISVVFVVVVIKLITLNLYAEIHDIFLCLYGWHNFHSCEFLGNSNTWIFLNKKRNHKQKLQLLKIAPLLFQNPRLQQALNDGKAIKIHSYLVEIGQHFLRAPCKTNNMKYALIVS